MDKWFTISIFIFECAYDQTFHGVHVAIGGHYLQLVIYLSTVIPGILRPLACRASKTFGPFGSYPSASWAINRHLSPTGIMHETETVLVQCRAVYPCPISQPLSKSIFLQGPGCHFECHLGEHCLGKVTFGYWVSNGSMAGQWTLLVRHSWYQCQEETGAPPYLCVEIFLDGGRVLSL